MLNIDSYNPHEQKLFGILNYFWYKEMLSPQDWELLH